MLRGRIRCLSCNMFVSRTGMTALQECKVIRGSRGERVEHYSIGTLHFVFGVATSKGSIGIAVPAELRARVEGIWTRARVVAIRLQDRGTKVAFASVHLPPGGCTRGTFDKALES